MQPADSPLGIFITEPFQYLRAGLVSYIERNTPYRILGEGDQGVETLEAVETLHPDVLLINIHLPDLDGVQVVRELGKRDPNLKIIVLNVSPTEELVISALQAGARAYCLKESPPEHVVEAIQAVMRDEAWLAPLAARKLVNVIADGRVLPFSELIQGPTHQSGHINPYGLNPREQQVLSMIVEGNSNGDIAQSLFISYHTVKADVSNILQKLSVEDRVQAVVKALRERLV